MARRHFGRELWDHACAAVGDPDGLPTTECGEWTIDKLFFLCQYLAQTTQAMVGHPKFASINYVDLFCGNGVCSVQRGGRLRRFPGSAILAACCTKPFSQLLLADINPANVDALATRLSRLKVKSVAKTWVGDANDLASTVAAAIPARSLNVAFLDPYSLDFRFETVRSLAQQRPLDLLILFADGMDIVRNVEEYYYRRRSNKLDLFLGSENWRKDWDALQNRDGASTRAMFADCYLRQLSQIGYTHSRTRVICGDTGPLYRLVYASKHPLGLKFWDIAVKEDRAGNRDMFGP